MNQKVLIYNKKELIGTEYSTLFITDMTKKLDDLFGFDYLGKFALKYHKKIQNSSLKVEDIDDIEIFMNIQNILAVSHFPIRGLTGEINIPVSQEVKNNFRSANCLLGGYPKSENIVNYFSGLAKKVGFFFALSYDEVIKADNEISENIIRQAVNEGYVRVGVNTQFNATQLKIIEVSDKFCPLEKILEG